MNAATWLKDKVQVYSPQGGSVSRSAISQARLKIKASYYTHINENICNMFYEGNQCRMWKNNWQVVAMDGTSLICNKLIYEDIITNKNQEELDDLKENHPHILKDEKQIHAVTLHDVINDICLGYTLDLKSIGERELATRLKRFLKPNMILVLDRGYPAAWLFQFLISLGIKFVIRVKKDHCKEIRRFSKSGKLEKEVMLKVDKKYETMLSELGVTYKKKVDIRLVRIKKDGEEYILATNLDKTEASIDDLSELYRFRWGIETSYNTVKTYLKLEGWRINNEEGVKIDFAIKCLLYNLSSIISKPAELEIAKFQAVRENQVIDYQWKNKICKCYRLESLLKVIEPIVCKQPNIDIDFVLRNYLIDLVRSKSITKKNRSNPRPKKDKPQRHYLMNKKIA